VVIVLMWVEWPDIPLNVYTYGQGSAAHLETASSLSLNPYTIIYSIFFWTVERCGSIWCQDKTWGGTSGKTFNSG
jgi:hypothetical protein